MTKVVTFGSHLHLKKSEKKNIEPRLILMYILWVTPHRKKKLPFALHYSVTTSSEVLLHGMHFSHKKYM